MRFALRRQQPSLADLRDAIVNRWPTLLQAAVLVIALASTAVLAGCGGGDGDEPDAGVCYVEGKPMPSKACK